MRTRGRVFLVGAGAAVGLAALALVDVRVTGTWRGLYLLGGDLGWEVADDLFLGDESRFVFGVDVRRRAEDGLGGYGGPRPILVHDWAAWDGTGWVRNLLPGGREIVTTFSRFVDAEGRHPQGLFIGGRPPLLPGNEGTRVLNQSGMAYYDGVRWFHVWCNANEAIGNEEGDLSVPGVEWSYEGGEVLVSGTDVLVLRSEHLVHLGDGELAVVREAFFRAGEPYVLLEIVVANPGTEPVTFRYGYGDDPWLGDYGSSGGNVGWVEGRTVLYEEWVDPTVATFAGYFDYGNEAIGAPHSFTNLANFLEWHPETRPSAAYFSNSVGSQPADGQPVPLAGGERAITLEWGPGALAPGAATRILLAVGLASPGSSVGLPRKPAVDWSLAERGMSPTVRAR